MKSICALFVVLALGFAATGAARAETFTFNFGVDGSQEVPNPNSTNAVGAASLVYDTDTKLFDLDLQVFGIGLDELQHVGANGTPVHIHNAPAGVNGPIVIDLGFFNSFVDDGFGISYTVFDRPFGGLQGGINSNIQANEDALFAGNLYLNVHTHDFPGGQIRGQIVPEPAALAVLLLGAFAYSRRR